VLVVAVTAALLVVIVVALADMGRTTADRTRAQTAADAAALASVEGDRARADDLAGAHGATVIAWSTGPGPDEVTVTVRLGEVTATARASISP
jgi:Flp pilus assembly protein TadG